MRLPYGQFWPSHFRSYVVQALLDLSQTSFNWKTMSTTVALQMHPFNIALLYQDILQSLKIAAIINVMTINNSLQKGTAPLIALIPQQSNDYSAEFKDIQWYGWLNAHKTHQQQQTQDVAELQKSLPSDMRRALKEKKKHPVGFPPCP